MTLCEWDDFAVRCTGEWEGRQRLYAGDGTVVPIPDWLVPEEFVQWGIPFNDIITQVSMKVSDEGLSGKIVRQIPQAGCQSDIVHIHSKEAFQSSRADESDQLSVYPCGSYVREVTQDVLNATNGTLAGPYKVPSELHDRGLRATEFCIVREAYAPNAEDFKEAGHRQRIRVTCVRARDSAYDEAPLYIIFTLERWSSDYNNAQSLGTCASAAAVAPLADPAPSGTDGQRGVDLPQGVRVECGPEGALTVSWRVEQARVPRLTRTFASDGKVLSSTLTQ